MKKLGLILSTAAVVALGTTESWAGTAYYVRSIVEAPWGQVSNETAMDKVFGNGGWTQGYFETVSTPTLFGAGTSFIFLEGGDTNADELEAFLTTNISDLQSWVSGGGRLFLNAAPNEGDGMSYGFGGISLIYPDFGGAGDAFAVNASHPIFNGPFTPVGTGYTGNFFSHASLTGGSFSPIMEDGDGSPVLAELAYGSGLALFGGLTTDNFHDPHPEAANLTANILAYVNGGVVATPDAGASAGMILVALSGLMLFKRKSD